MDRQPAEIWLLKRPAMGGGGRENSERRINHHAEGLG